MSEQLKLEVHREQDELVIRTGPRRPVSERKYVAKMCNGADTELAKAIVDAYNSHAALIEDLRRLQWEHAQILELVKGTNPGGSEFHDSPVNCVWMRKRQPPAELVLQRAAQSRKCMNITPRIYKKIGGLSTWTI